MQLSGISNSYGSSGIQRALAALVSQAKGASQGAGQVLPGGDQDSDGDGPSAPPPPRSSGQASSQFAANTLASLLSVQQQPSASDFASKLIGQVDANGDGSLSLDEIKSTLEKAGLTQTSKSTSASNSDPLAQAFGKLDSNGDGKLDSTELASALEAMMKSHHGHRHGPPPPPPQDATTAVASTDTTTAAATTSTASTTTTTGVGATAASGG